MQPPVQQLLIQWLGSTYYYNVLYIFPRWSYNKNHWTAYHVECQQQSRPMWCLRPSRGLHTVAYRQPLSTRHSKDLYLSFTHNKYQWLLPVSKSITTSYTYSKPDLWEKLGKDNCQSLCSDIDSISALFKIRSRTFSQASLNFKWEWIYIPIYCFLT